MMVVTIKLAIFKHYKCVFIWNKKIIVHKILKNMRVLHIVKNKIFCALIWIVTRFYLVKYLISNLDLFKIKNVVFESVVATIKKNVLDVFVVFVNMQINMVIAYP